VLSVGAVVALGACGSSGSGASKSTNVAASEQTTAAASSSGKRYSIIEVDGPLNDPFFSAVARGAKDAGKAFGVDVQYLAPAESGAADPAAWATLIDNSISQHPNAMVIPNWSPDVFNPLIKRATQAGIPVISRGAGAESVGSNGSIGYVGQDEVEAGRAAGKAMAAAGAKKGLCVMHYPGVPVLEARCKGFDETMKAAGASSTSMSMLATDANNASALTQNIAGSLQKDPSIDAVFTLGSQVAMSAVEAVKQAGSKAKVGTADLSTPVLDAVESGDLLFAIDQQPYLQSYQSVMSLVLELRYGLHPVGQVLTGPLLITKDNVTRVKEINAQQTGIRGAA
jgi:simple sugar transport system substrate-binding protein